MLESQQYNHAKATIFIHHPLKEAKFKKLKIRTIATNSPGPGIFLNQMKTVGIQMDNSKI